MENQYLDEAWNNRPDHHIYGFRLKPFCLYYLHLLQSIKSPLLSATAPFTPQQLFLAAEICSSEWSEEGYTLDRLMRPGQIRLRRNQLRVCTVNFKKQIAKWVEYYADFLVVAKKWEDSGEKYDEFGHCIGFHKKMGRKDLDRVMATASVIIATTGWDEKKVMMMPIGRAFGWADYFAIQQGDDKIKYVTAKEEADMERDRIKMAEIERKNGAVKN